MEGSLIVTEMLSLYEIIMKRKLQLIFILNETHYTLIWHIFKIKTLKIIESDVANIALRYLKKNISVYMFLCSHRI